MNIWTKKYSVVEDDGFFFVFKEYLLFNHSFSGEFILPGYETEQEAENRHEEITNPKNVQIHE